MFHDLKQYYWWRGIKKDATDYVSKCLVCQQVKAPSPKPAGLLQPLDLPQWKWEDVAMNFITGLTRGFTVICVIINGLTKLAHFLPEKPTYSIEK